jgi:TRAP-type C4-dicarboxylate transport system permease small subunit
MWSRLETLTFSGARLLALVGLAGLLILAFATVTDALLRWLFNAPITGVRDAAALFVAAAISCSMPICIAERQHITIRFIGMQLGRRGEAALEAFGNLATLVIFALMAWQLWLYANHLSAENETTMVLAWPVAPWWRGVSMVAAFCVPVQVVVLLQSLRWALFGRRLSTENDSKKSEDLKRYQ